MNRTQLNFVVDGLLFLTLLVVLVATAITDAVFPPASQSVGWRLLGLTLDGWMRIRLILLVTFTVLTMVHLMLHWKWICVTAAQQVSLLTGVRMRLNESYETLVGVGLLVGILHVLGIVFLAASFALTPPEEGQEASGSPPESAPAPAPVKPIRERVFAP
jgi:hypothetical protein